MKLTQFLKLKKAVDALDPDIIRKRLRQLDARLLDKGIPFEPQNTAITQEGIFYIEPESGIATKVIAYVSDYQTNLTDAQRSILAPEGYTDKSSIEKFHSYHLMQCNTLMVSERDGWREPYRITKRTDGRLYYRITSIPDKKKKIDAEIYQVIKQQQLYVCKYCFWKAASILDGAQGEKREDFQAKHFFDVNLLHSWNSLGLLSKDFGFTKDMYPEDWLEICRIRKAQVGYRCEMCCEDLSEERLKPYLCVYPTDHVVDHEGYLRLECVCVSCLADLPAYADVKARDEYRAYRMIRGLPLEEEEKTRHDDVLALLREDSESGAP